MEKEIIKKNFLLEWNNNKKNLKKIVEYYVDNYKKIKYNNIYYNIIKINTNNDDILYSYKTSNDKGFIKIDEELINIYNFMFSSRYIGNDIRLYIQNKINNCYKYNFDHMDLYFFDNKDVDNNTIEFIYKITKWIYDINPIHKIRLFIFNIPIKKKMTNKITKKCKKPTITNYCQDKSSGGHQGTIFSINKKTCIKQITKINNEIIFYNKHKELLDKGINILKDYLKND